MEDDGGVYKVQWRMVVVYRLQWGPVVCIQGTMGDGGVYTRCSGRWCVYRLQ